MKKCAFIARMPDEPGALHRAVSICHRHAANINRLQYDRRIDPATVFFEITSDEESYTTIVRELAQIGYLQVSLKPPSYLKFHAYLLHRPGSLDEFLAQITRSGANIGFIGFDDTGAHPDRLTVSLNAGQGDTAGTLMDCLKSRYRLEIVEYDESGTRLDDTVFYIRFAQDIRTITGNADDPFLLSFLSDANHIAQELMDRGNDPQKVFSSILATGRALRSTTGAGFYADVQQFRITTGVDLSCIQLPCGGNIFLFRTADELVMVDTGYGIYYHDVCHLLERLWPGSAARLTRIIITHADADHCGASGWYHARVFMHPLTGAVIRENNRAYGSRCQGSVLEAFYTRMINMFSEFSGPHDASFFLASADSMRTIFPVLATVAIGDVSLEVLGSPGGHLAGQVYLYSEEDGVLLAADSLINFSSLTPERSAYNALADFLITSVNVDSALARLERTALFELAAATDAMARQKGKRCLVCGGHGAVSVPEGDTLVTYGPVEHCTLSDRDCYSKTFMVP